MKNYKVIMLGDSAVGKSTLICSYINEGYQPKESTIGIDFFNIKISLQNTDIHLCVWDSAGQQNFRSLAKCYYNEADVVLFCFNLNEPQTLSNLDNWLMDCQQKLVDCSTFLVGTQMDKEVLTSRLQAEKWASVNKMTGYVEVSSKNLYSLKKLFMMIGQQVRNKNPKKVKRESTKLQEKKQSKKKSCC